MNEESFDDRLVDAACAGDEDALEQLLVRHIPTVEAMVRLRAGKLVRAKESTRDIAQSVCREALRNIERFHRGGEQGFRHWLLATVMRKISNKHEFWMAARRDAAREAAAWTGDGEARFLEAYQSVTSPSRRLMAREEIDRIESAFDQLSPEDRDLIIRARFLEMSREEIAAEDGVNAAAIRVRLHRALAKLAVLLD